MTELQIGAGEHRCGDWGVSTGIRHGTGAVFTSDGSAVSVVPGLGGEIPGPEGRGLDR